MTREQVEALKDLLEAGHVSDWRVLDAALDAAIALAEAVRDAPVAEVTREDWLENFETFGPHLIGQRVALVVLPDADDGGSAP